MFKFEYGVSPGPPSYTFSSCSAIVGKPMVTKEILKQGPLYIIGMFDFTFFPRVNVKPGLHTQLRLP